MSSVSPFSLPDRFCPSPSWYSAYSESLVESLGMENGLILSPSIQKLPVPEVILNGLATVGSVSEKQEHRSRGALCFHVRKNQLDE